MLFDALTKPLFRTLARLRGARVFHPRGAAHEATWHPADGSHLSPMGREQPAAAVVRVSRGAGLPPSLPDVLGVAIKLLDLHGPGRDQDLLLASVAGAGRWGSRVLLPRWRFAGATFSSVLPYGVEGYRTPVVATVDGEPSTSPGAGDGRGVRVRVVLQRSGAPLGTAVLDSPLAAAVSEDLLFDPWHTGESFRPVGVWNRLRRPVYVASQQGRGAPPAGARDGRLGQ